MRGSIGKSLRSALGAATVTAGIAAPLALAVPTVAGATPAVTLYVRSGASGSACTSPMPPNACNSVASAVDVAKTSYATDAVTITVGSGTYAGTRTISTGSTFASLSIHGAGPSTTILDAETSGRVFDVASDAVKISGLTLEGGSAGTGGALIASGVDTLDLSDDVFVENSATNAGGAVYIVTSDHVVLTDVQLSQDTATEGGAVAMTGTTTVTLSNDRIFRNHGTDGAGVANLFGSDAHFTHDTFSPTAEATPFCESQPQNCNDYSFGDGGAVYNDGGSSATFDDVTFDDAGATKSGGAIANLTSSAATFSSVTFTRTSAGTTGGALYNGNGAHVTLDDAVFTHDTSANGGAIYNFTGASVNVTTATFATDDAFTFAGAVSNINTADFTAVRATFSGDHSGTYAGALYNGYGGTVHLTNVTFVHDTTGIAAGAYYGNSGVATFLDVTFATDEAEYGGGINFTTGDTEIAVSNSIFSHSTCSGFPFIVSAYDVETGDSCGFGSTSLDTSTTIHLSPLAVNTSTGPMTMAIGPTSSAFELVSRSSCAVAVDERGEPRPGVPGANCDAGAYEYQGAQPGTGAAVTVRRIYGATADATAASELESVFGAACPGSSGDRPVVLATDQGYGDALSSAYLAKDLSTGTLLTPTRSLSEATKAALKKEGITHVYVVGGPLAISTSVVSDLEKTPASSCGGTGATGSDIVVTRIYGNAAATTAAKIASVPPPSFVGSVDLAGAYGGRGKDNTTTGGSSGQAAASGPLRTAIVASDAEFQDAEAGATLSYAEDLPILLATPGALPEATTTAITSLGIRQVVLLGGPLAVSTAVVGALEEEGVSVLRVAGTDASGTAVELASLETASSSAHEGFSWDATHSAGFAVARGDAYQDGLAGAVVAANGLHGSGPVPLLLTEGPSTLGQDLATYLREVGAKGVGSPPSPVSFLLVLGGPDALSSSVLAQIEGDL